MGFAGWLSALLNLLGLGAGEPTPAVVTPEVTFVVPALARALSVPAPTRSFAAPALARSFTVPDPE